MQRIQAEEAAARVGIPKRRPLTTQKRMEQQAMGTGWNAGNYFIGNVINRFVLTLGSRTVDQMIGRPLKNITAVVQRTADHPALPIN